MKKLLTLIFIAGAFASCTMNSNNGGNMSSNDKGAMNEAGLQKFYDQVMNAHNAALIDSFCVPGFVDHTPEMGHTVKSSDDLKGEFKDLFTSFPDVNIKAEFMASRGDTVFAKVNLKGTNTGPMGPNMPATNKSFDIEGVDIIVLKDGKATDRWGYMENQKMMQQLGLIPDMGSMEKAGKKMDEKMEKMGMEKKK